MIHLLSDRVHGTTHYRCHTEALCGRMWKGTGIFSFSDESIFVLMPVIDNDKHKNARRELQKNSRSFCCLLVWVGNVFWNSLGITMLLTLFTLRIFIISSGNLHWGYTWLQTRLQISLCTRTTRHVHMGFLNRKWIFLGDGHWKVLRF